MEAERISSDSSRVAQTWRLRQNGEQLCFWKQWAAISRHPFLVAGWPGAPSAVWLVVAGSLLLGFASAFAVEPLALRSRSGQFVVRGLPVGAPFFTNAAASAVSYVRLDPAALLVSCERIKDALLAELDMRDRWRGKIYISLHPVREDNEPINILSVHHPEGWNYHVDLPEMVDRSRL